MRSPSRILNCSTYPVPTDIDNSQELLDYVNFRHSTFLNYRQASDIGPEHYGSLITKAVQFVGQDLPTSILSGSDDPNFMLELGVRYAVLPGLRNNLLPSFCTGNGQDTVHLRTDLRQ